MELSKLSVTELRRLKVRVDAEISRRTDSTKRDLLKKMQKMASDAGLSFTDLVGKPAAPSAVPSVKRTEKKTAADKPVSKVAPKYAHPEDSSLTWTGRGRQPIWVAKCLAEGKTLEDLLINKA